MSISERQKEERALRKERILSGALTVFKTKGLDGATMDEIAAESGFGKATLYYYFPSKEDVFCGILDRGWTQLWESLEEDIHSDTGPRETFINILIKIAKKAQQNRNEYEFMFNAPKAISNIDDSDQDWKSYQHQLYAILKGLLDDGISQGQFPKLDSNLMFKAIGGLFVGLIFMGEKNKDITGGDIEKLLNQLITDPTQP
ncbi:MAG: TetR/AcrR family transcriptional regulator [Candidatus Marinimicrobia bacterium]|jgi:AcrR family transcriptional regulator|nr:hypothetical protein [Candidatus Neomarinimicrobiota bacterium]MDP6499798.1 TetR/AcrR family transcriptional regulator [Candidatus Neomarinimicrobiota bacterium]|tara:strand:+ start:23967 stop:24569 length:603 start_codon:yes stop_codon:yes gene_type:complete